MRLPRDVSGDELARALGDLGYRMTRQTGSHLRLTTLEGGERREARRLRARIGRHRGRPLRDRGLDGAAGSLGVGLDRLGADLQPGTRSSRSAASSGGATLPQVTAISKTAGVTAAAGSPRASSSGSQPSPRPSPK